MRQVDAVLYCNISPAVGLEMLYGELRICQKALFYANLKGEKLDITPNVAALICVGSQMGQVCRRQPVRTQWTASSTKQLLQDPHTSHI